MSWKQPISTELEKEFGEDTECYILMVLLIIKASNSEGVMSSGNSVHTIKRGEVVFGRKSWSKYFGGSEFKATRALQRLENMHNKVHIKPTNKYTLVELINYDELVRLEQQSAQQTNNKLTTDAQQTHTSLDAKSEKSAKTDKENTPDKEEFSPDQKELDSWVSVYNSVMGTRFKPTQALIGNFRYWRKDYEPTEMEEALRKLPDSWMANGEKPCKPELVLRKTERSGIACDRIGELLNQKVKSRFQ